MTLIRRPASPGDRLTWRRPVVAPVDQPTEPVAPITAVPQTTAEEADAYLDAERAHGIGQALDRLTSRAGTPLYRRTRALVELQASVERQAKIAGLGHLHVGTAPCGPMCQPLGRHADGSWRAGR